MIPLFTSYPPTSRALFDLLLLKEEESWFLRSPLPKVRKPSAQVMSDFSAKFSSSEAFWETDLFSPVGIYIIRVNYNLEFLGHRAKLQWHLKALVKFPIYPEDFWSNYVVIKSFSSHFYYNFLLQAWQLPTTPGHLPCDVCGEGEPPRLCWMPSLGSVACWALNLDV